MNPYEASEPESSNPHDGSRPDPLLMVFSRSIFSLLVGPIGAGIGIMAIDWLIVAPEIAELKARQPNAVICGNSYFHLWFIGGSVGFVVARWLLHLALRQAQAAR